MPLASAIACLLLALGFTLLFFGNRLAQWGFNLAAVSGAGLAGAMLGKALGLPEWQVWLLASLTAGVGCLLAAFLFQVWMGISTMVFMGVLVLGMVVIWQGPPLPTMHTAHPAGLEADTMHQLWQDSEAALRHWWQQKPGNMRHVLQLAMGIGAMLGLGLGLAMPLRAAALQCAAAGAGLTLAATGQLVALQWPKGALYLPESPRAIMLVFLVAVALGFTAQSRGGDDGDNDGENQKKAAE